MSSPKMHADEVDTHVELVRELLTTQFPQWSHLPLRPVPSAGTDNALFRLGESMVVRLPRIHWAVGQVDKEQEWLPKLAPSLPLQIPVPLAKGVPGHGYPWNWSIYRWIEGENQTIERCIHPQQTAIDLANFIKALQRIDIAGGPLPGAHNVYRGEPLVNRDQNTRDALDRLAGELDTGAVLAVWKSALAAGAWDRPPVWLHGDLQGGNLLMKNGRLHAVIDFGCLSVGDPAVDVMAAWLFLSAELRPVFREILQVDNDTWARGRGWALTVGLVALPYYEKRNPVLANIARRTIDEVLLDFRGE